MNVLPSGEQLEIRRQDQRATIVEVGGGIREYFCALRPVLDPYPAQATCDGAHGAPLMPWPNRLAGGRYSFDGHDYQLALTEPEAGNAIHGLLRWRNWRASERARSRVVMATRLHPLTGWPFTLDVAVEYSLDEDGLSVLTTATNVGSVACPFGSGHHPYLSPGPGALVDECTLQLPARTRILPTPASAAQAPREPVEGTACDFRRPRRIGELRIDDPFGDLECDEEGRARLRLGCPDGRSVELWCDESYPLLQLYTGDTLAPARRRVGLAVEPMTCPPNALQTGEGIVRLEPGERHTSRWGVRLI